MVDLSTAMLVITRGEPSRHLFQVGEVFGKKFHGIPLYPTIRPINGEAPMYIPKSFPLIQHENESISTDQRFARELLEENIAYRLW